MGQSVEQLVSEANDELAEEVLAQDGARVGWTEDEDYPATFRRTESVYQKIARVIRKVADIGLQKDQKNSFDNYMFRGIDGVYNLLAPILGEVGLVIIPEVLDRSVVERESNKGSALFYVTLKVNFHFISADDGSRVTAVAFGEAMDRGDKATNKAMSAAYKYACFETFCIPTEAQDADKETHEVKPKAESVAKTTARENGIDTESKQVAEYVAGIEAALFNEDQPGLFELLDELDNDLKIAVWTKLGSKERSAIKKYQSERKA